MLYDAKGQPLPPVSNVDQNKAENATITRQLDKKQVRRVTEDMTKFRQALQRAEQVRNPNRADLHRIYRYILLDSHITAQVETRKNNIKRKGFRIVNAEGEEQEELTALIRTDWFRTVIDHTMDSKFWGFSVIELGPVVEDRFAWVKELNPDHIRPEKLEFVIRPYDREGIPFTEEPYEPWTFFVGSQTEFGLLLHLTMNALWKISSFSAWADYNELFGIPLAIGYTESGDRDTKDDLEAALADLHDSHYAVMNQGIDNVELKEAAGGSYPTFNDMVRTTNQEISKLILGQTMSSEDGSSRSQAEVHERVMRDYEEADMHLVTTVVNEELIPRMQRFGMFPEGVSFEFDEREDFNLQQRWDVTKAVLQTPGYRVPPEYIQQEFGVEVEETAMTGGEEPSPNEGPAENAGLFMRRNAAVSDFPQEAMDLAAEAREFVRQNPGSGSDQAKRINRRIINQDPIGVRTLRDIRTYAANRPHAEKPWKENRLSLNYALVGGRAMVEEYAAEKLGELRNWIEEASRTMKKTASLYDADRGPDK